MSKSLDTDYTDEHGFKTQEQILVTGLRVDGVAKIPPHGVIVVFRTSTYNMYAFTPEKPLSLVGRSFCLAISRAFASVSFIGRSPICRDESRGGRVG
jgi:hypothetical protein